MRMRGILSGLLIFVFLLTAAGCSSNKDRDYKDEKFKPGQVWKYKNRPGEENSTIQILKVENYSKDGILIHIAIRDVKILPGKKHSRTEIDHLVFTRDAVDNSVTELAKETDTLPDFSKQYQTWIDAYDKDRAGIVDSLVSEAVTSREKTLNMAPY